MRFKQALILGLTALLVSNASAQLNITPEEDNVIDTNQTNTSIVSSTPFEANLSNGNVTVSPTLDIDPGTYNQTVEYQNKTRYYDLNVEEVFNWNLTPENLNSSINVGESGQIDNITAKATGNIDKKLDLGLEGEIENYFSTTESETVFPDIEKSIVLSYQVQNDVEFGNYTGNLTAEQGNETKKVNLEIDFKDSIDPEILDTDIPDYEATKLENFSVKATDNYEVGDITGGVVEQVEVNNSLENKTFKNVSFEKEENSDKWFVDPEIDSPGTYWITLYVEDKAGNTVNASEKFEVSKLDAVSFDNSKSIEIPVYRTDSEIKQSIGSIDEDTEVTFTLESFSESLDDEESVEDWSVGIFTDSQGYEYFSNVNDSVTFDQSANISVIIEGTESTSFNGQIDIKGVEQHREIDSVNFNGEYVDCPVPREYRFEFAGQNLTYKPVNADKCSEAGWNVTQFVSASSVPAETDVRKDLQLVIPSEMEERQEMIQDEIIQRWKNNASDWKNISYILTVLFGASIYMVFFAVYKRPYIFHLDIKTAESKLRKIRRRAKLGIKGEE